MRTRERTRSARARPNAVFGFGLHAVEARRITAHRWLRGGPQGRCALRDLLHFIRKTAARCRWSLHRHRAEVHATLRWLRCGAISDMRSRTALERAANGTHEAGVGVRCASVGVLCACVCVCVRVRVRARARVCVRVSNWSWGVFLCTCTCGRVCGVVMAVAARARARVCGEAGRAGGGEGDGGRTFSTFISNCITCLRSSSSSLCCCSVWSCASAAEPSRARYDYAAANNSTMRLPPGPQAERKLLRKGRGRAYMRVRYGERPMHRMVNQSSTAALILCQCARAVCARVYRAAARCARSPSAAGPTHPRAPSPPPRAS